MTYGRLPHELLDLPPEALAFDYEVMVRALIVKR